MAANNVNFINGQSHCIIIGIILPPLISQLFHPGFQAIVLYNCCCSHYSPDEKGETTLDAMIMDGYGT